ncbi:hypothetical protein DFA_04454 [Cavenderia fasciculata]|uniref:Uncharacterized protein n=1 Tax=Cavenderia fasciculata TaxID=261658 RepID=F4PPM3_CACFS|nr:uncharacterized protein DFA_04454 [Cavenderia fasciculata]EGG22336.1 hypothetical protein DFA_04454 [Cavenderia fasciculata]|eukprot:XP_004360187.1 hypothetical protein DFA_04454 [Cavenderia fasciculata]
MDNNNKKSIIISLDNEQLSFLHTNKQKICIVRNLMDKTMGNTIWAAFQPFQHNVIEWKDQSFGLFASSELHNVASRPKGPIPKDCVEDTAYSHLLYTFNQGAFTRSFLTQDPKETQRLNNPSSPKTYTIVNKSGGLETFGLFQTFEVSINNKRFERVQLDAQTVGNEETIKFQVQPLPTFFIFIGPDTIQAGDHIPTLPSDGSHSPFKLSFDTSHTQSKKVSYDSNTKEFYLS